MNLAGSWQIGSASLMGQYHSYKLDNTTGVDPKQTNLMIGATFGMGAGTLKASYGRATVDSGVAGAPDQKATQAALGYQYDLSKRTALYATYSSLDNDGSAATGARYTVGQGATLTAGGQKSTGYNVGVRHSF
jgi:predicted porin